MRSSREVQGYGTTGVTFLKKRTNFTFIHFLPQMNGEKTAAVKKIYNTNEHITPSEAASQLCFWCFRKRNLKKADSFKRVHQSWISFHENSSVLWSETSKKELDNGHFFIKTSWISRMLLTDLPCARNVARSLRHLISNPMYPFVI